MAAIQSGRRPVWPWVLLILLAMALMWYFFRSGWQSEQASDAIIGPDVRDLKPESPGPADPGYYGDYNEPGEVGKSRPDQTD